MIRSVSMRNWKAHDELSLSFREGINFLVGPNGAGKTSVLDAICFALLGDLGASAIYRGLTYKDFIGNAERDMEISLVFCPQGGDEYTVTRTHSARAAQKRATLSLNGKVVRTRWDEVTSEIIRLLETSALFLRRVILLSEGDTFEYSTRPPGEGLTRHIENVLGINRMEDLRLNLEQLRGEFGREARERRAALEAVTQSTDKDRSMLEQLRDELARLQKEKDWTAERIDALNKSVGEVSSDVRRVEELIGRLKSVVQEWEELFGEIPQNYEFLGAIEALRESLHRERLSLAGQRDDLRDELSWLAAQIQSQSRILELVQPLEREDREVACPVCKRPLSAKMVEDLEKECVSVLVDLKGRREEKAAQLPDMELSIQEADTNLEKLLSIRSEVSVISEQEPRSLSVPVLESYSEELLERRDAAKQEVVKLRIEADQMDKRIVSTDLEFAELEKRMDQTRRLGMMRSLTRATKGEYVSELLLESLESALAEQRGRLLEPLTEELSTVWSTFLGVELDVSLKKDDAQILISDKSRKADLEFPQLSGGEKTALLIFTQVLLCKYFSSADFMMIDEPLEHLDARNKWALMRYLVDTTSSAYPKQLILTTIEEPLVREYSDHEGVSTSLLSKGQAMLVSNWQSREQPH